MIRKLLLTAFASALLAGCATYGYRGGHGGDYYYGQPGTQYRVYGSYGYPGYYGYAYPGSYYGYYGYGAPYWGSYYRYYRPSRPPHHGDHDHDHDGDHGSPGSGHDRPDRPKAPWRDLENVGRPRVIQRQDVPRAPAVVRPQRSAPVQAAPRPPRVGGWKRDARRTPAP
jgi:hypothetical protein